MDSLARRPLLLRPDNFTPPTRTPWGGTKIVAHYKLDHAGSGAQRVVGESWELSVGPEFPSLLEDGTPLAEALATDPIAALGAEAEAGSTALLVKLLDAADELSVQIHPRDDDPRLGPGESGKPESWYVLERDEGAGLYIGLREGVDEARMRSALIAGDDVSELLTFVPVEPGDFFLIEAGTAHAIGRGVTLVEPQRVAPGRRGLTYRYWDWNRRYDAEGRQADDGSPRPLHVDRALEVTAWDAPRGDAMLDAIRVRAPIGDPKAAAAATRLCGPAALLASDSLRVTRLAGTGPLVLPPADRLRGLTVVAGGVDLRGPGVDVRVDRGRTVALPASVPALTAHLHEAHAVLSAAG